MIKIKQMIKEDLTRLLLEELYSNLNQKDFSRYLFDFSISDRNYKKILFDNNTNVNVRDNEEQTPLIQACGKNNLLKVKLLLSHPKVNVNAYEHRKITALMFACSNDNKEVVKLLLTHPDINVNFISIIGASALSWASNNDNILMVKLLLLHPKIDVMVTNERNYTVFNFTNDRKIKKLLKNHPSYKEGKNVK